MTSNYCICLYPLPHAIAYLQGVCEWRKWCMQKVIVGGEDEIIALFIVHLLFVFPIFVVSNILKCTAGMSPPILCMGIISIQNTSYGGFRTPMGSVNAPQYTCCADIFDNGKGEDRFLICLSSPIP